MTRVCHGVMMLERLRDSFRTVGGPCLFPLKSVRRVLEGVVDGSGVEVPEEIE